MGGYTQIINIHMWQWVIAASIFSVIPIILIRFSVEKRRYTVIAVILSIVVYMALIYFYYKLLPLGSIATVYGMTKGASIVILAIIGMIFFHDLSTWKAWLGISLAIIAVVLLL